MKPINYDKDRPALSISSSQVVWDGPDLPCIELCNGEVIDQVIYDLAKELCDLLKALDINSLDLSCFNLGNCAPKDLHSFLQFLIDKICQLNNITNQQQQGLNCKLTCPITLPECFRVTGTVPLWDPDDPDNSAVTIIANKICNLVTDITGIQSSITTINNQITTIYTLIENISTGFVSLTLPPDHCLNLTGCPSGGTNTADYWACVINAIVQALCPVKTYVDSILSSPFLLGLTYSPPCSTTTFNTTPPWNSFSLIFDAIFNKLCELSDNVTGISSKLCPDANTECFYLDLGEIIIEPNPNDNRQLYFKISTPVSNIPFLSSTFILYNSNAPSTIVNITGTNAPTITNSNGIIDLLDTTISNLFNSNTCSDMVLAANIRTSSGCCKSYSKSFPNPFCCKPVDFISATE